jgi:hypothetical protein
MANDRTVGELERFLAERADRLMRTAVLLTGSRDAGHRPGRRPVASEEPTSSQPRPLRPPGRAMAGRAAFALPAAASSLSGQRQPGRSGCCGRIVARAAGPPA